MGIRLWIDDVREPPSDEWTWAKTLAEAMDHIQSPTGVKEISFDHDLGEKYKADDGWYRFRDSQPVARYLEEKAYSGELLTMPVWHIHSMNPVGRKELYAILQSAERYVKERVIPDAIHEDGTILEIKTDGH